MLKIRQECDTYLTHICGHHRNRENPVKKIKYKIELSANTGFHQLQTQTLLLIALSYINIFSLGSLRYGDVYKCKPGRYRTLPFFLIFFYHFTFPGFPFILINLCKDISLVVNIGKTKYMEAEPHWDMEANDHITVDCTSYEKK